MRELSLSISVLLKRGKTFPRGHSQFCLPSLQQRLTCFLIVQVCLYLRQEIKREQKKEYLAGRGRGGALEEEGHQTRQC